MVEMKNSYEWLGFVAGILTTSSFLPQALKTWRSRSAADFSWPYLVLFGTGVALWGVYGWLDQDKALILANGVTLLLFLVIVFTKALYPSKE